MTASELLTNLQQRGVLVETDGAGVRLTALPGVLTDSDRAAVREHKPALLALLTRPPLGSFRRPLAVRGRRLAECPFDGCAGAVTQLKESTARLCGKCGWYFELLPPEVGFAV